MSLKNRDTSAAVKVRNVDVFDTKIARVKTFREPWMVYAQVNGATDLLNMKCPMVFRVG